VKYALPHPQNPDKRIKVNMIPEGDLYRLIFSSKLPAAEKFEAWICDEILIHIRKHGAYITFDTLNEMQNNAEYAKNLLDNLSLEYEKNVKLETQITELTPKARYCDLILQSKYAIQTTIIAKDYGMTAADFNQLLHDFKIQYKVGGTWILYKNFAGKDYTITKTFHVNETTGKIHTYWTQRGRLFLYNILKNSGIVPLVELFDDLDEMEDEELYE
jgi:phage antirepressor YoqD-like protein